MAKRKIRGISWQTIRLEGSLFVPDLLDQIFKNEASNQKARDYQIPPGLTLDDEIGRSYQIARALYADFKVRRQDAGQNQFQVTETFFTKFMTNCLGWTTYERARSKRVGEYGYPVQKIAFNQIPLTVAQSTISLDTSDERFKISGARERNRSLFQMVQEYLNASGKNSWAVISNGLAIRVMRSSPTLVRPQYLEFDLQSILEDDHYNEFALLWKILHVSRVFNIEDQIEMTIWEEWRNETIQTGERVLDGLRRGVTKALVQFGSGFIANPANNQLREKLSSGALSAEDLYHQLLRLIYRLLFLFALEERRAQDHLRLIFDPASSFEERDLYEKGYSVDRLRETMLHRSSYNSYTDLFKAQQIVFNGLAKGEKRLALPALGGLFAKGMCDDVDSAELDNGTYLRAMESLRWAMNSSGQYSYIDYKNMGTEEFGSVYESLLELVPKIDMPARRFGFIGEGDDETTAGNVRKTTGSYYTPSFLVDQLIKTALVPVIEKTIEENPENREKALLSLSVIDPSCGSGHFLIAAARKIAEYVAVARSFEGVITSNEYRSALRDVIRHCIYGVDLNPMAIELTKITLWLEGFEPGKPLSFLDQHLITGNSLLGVFDLSVLDEGIPNDAFKVLSGDDKEFCSELRKANAAMLKKYKDKVDEKALYASKDFFADPFLDDRYSPLDSMGEDSVDEVDQKARKYEELKTLMDQDPKMISSDIYVGAFLMQKTRKHSVPTTETLYRYNVLEQPSEFDVEAIKQARELCKKASVLHWPFAFPKILSKGGFDVVLGNPPWDMLQLDPREHFAQTHPDISKAKNMAKRSKLIEDLKNDDYASYFKYRQALYEVEALQNYSHTAKRFEYSGIGRLNLSSLFIETCFRLVNIEASGKAGLVVPSGVSTYSFTQKLFNYITDSKILSSFYDFENQGIFPAVHNSYKFSLLTLGATPSATFACFLHSIDELDDERRHFELTADDISLINPNTRTLPIFRSKKDAELTKKLYRNVPALIDETKGPEGNPWELRFQLMFMMNTDSSLFLDNPTLDSYPLYEAKMLHHYDHRWATYESDGTVRDVTLEEKMNPDFEVTPRYWIPKREVLNKIADVPNQVKETWYNQEEHLLRIALAECEDKELSKLATADSLMTKMDDVMDQRSPRVLLGLRNIAQATNERTSIASIIPLTAVGNKITILEIEADNEKLLLLLASFNNIVFDFVVRQKVGGTDLNHFYIKQFPVMNFNSFNVSAKAFIISRVKRLVSTSNTIAEALNTDLHIWDPESRAIDKAELDALFARLYGLNREELKYILDPESVMGEGYPSVTFPGLKNKEMREFGEYRTERLVLEAWDRLEDKPELWQ